jgi:hypothetical protein
MAGHASLSLTIQTEPQVDRVAPKGEVAAY